MIRIAILMALVLCGADAQADSAPASKDARQQRLRVSVLQVVPDPAVVRASNVRAAIEATGLPWRVVLMPSGLEFVLIPPIEATIPYSRIAPMSFMWRDLTVKLDYPFYMARMEVPNDIAASAIEGVVERQVRAFNSEARRARNELISGWRPTTRSASVGLSLGDANRISASQGCRIPTEAEWLTVFWCCSDSTSTTGRESEIPIGNALDLTTAKAFAFEHIATLSSDRSYGPTFGGRFAPNSLGVFDMVGNASEWTNGKIPPDWFWATITTTTRSTERHSRVVHDRDKSLQERGILCGTSWIDAVDDRSEFQVRRGGPLGVKTYDTKDSVTAGVRLAIDAEVVRDALSN